MPRYPDIECKWIPKSELWRRADQFFSDYWPEGTLPVEIGSIVEFRLGLDIIPVHALRAEIDVDAFLRFDLTGIIVDYDCYMEDRFQNRTRFSLAHEIGHFVLHKKIYNQLHKQLPNLSIMECREFILNMSEL